MRVIYDERAGKFLKNLPESDKGRVAKIIFLFQDKGFLLSEKHLKKITKGTWELRPGNIRLLFGIVNNTAVIVNGFIKKTNKTPLKEIKIAEQRLREYL